MPNKTDNNSSKSKTLSAQVKKAMNKYFKKGHIPSRKALLRYRELARRYLNGEGKKLNDVGKEVQKQRMNQIDKTLRNYYGN